MVDRYEPLDQAGYEQIIEAAEKDDSPERRAKMEEFEQELAEAGISARHIEGEGYVEGAVKLNVECKEVITLDEADELLKNRFKQE